MAYFFGTCRDTGEFRYVRIGKVVVRVDIARVLHEIRWLVLNVGYGGIVGLCPVGLLLRCRSRRDGQRATALGDRDVATSGERGLCRLVLDICIRTGIALRPVTLYVDFCTGSDTGKLRRICVSVVVIRMMIVGILDKVVRLVLDV